MRKIKVIAILLLVGLITGIGSIYVNGVDPVGVGITGWKMDVIGIRTERVLKTTETIVLYTGDIEYIEHIDNPRDGYIYTLVDIQVKRDSGNMKFDPMKLQLYLDEQLFDRMEGTSFLSNHGLNSFTYSGVDFGSSDGVLLFEIEEKYSTRVSEMMVFYEGEQLETIVEPNESLTNIRVINNIFEEQKKYEEDILTFYESGSYSLSNPLVVKDPYKNTPLTALVLFATEGEREITVSVEGKHDDASVEYTKEGYATEHEIPVLGLYGGYDNIVHISAIDRQGNVDKSAVVITTDMIPAWAAQAEIMVNKGGLEPGVTFMYTGSKEAIDQYGDIRWYSTDGSGESYTELSNGRFMYSFGAKHMGISTMVERDIMGKTYGVYTVPFGMHHHIEELPNGNLLVATCNPDGLTIEDYFIEIERHTGVIVNEVDMRTILDNNRTATMEYSAYDWFHMNAIHYYDGKIILSGRHQNVVVQLTYPELEIQWMLGNHEGWSEMYQPFLLEPIGENFEWQWAQHAPEVLPDYDNNPDTIDVLLFDNGVNRSTSSEFALSPSESYSNLVHYRINTVEMKVELLREYGKDRGQELFSDSGSDADLQPLTGNWLGGFTAINKTAEGEASRTGSSNTDNLYTILIEVDSANEVVWEAKVSNNVKRFGAYRVERRELYLPAWEYSIREEVDFLVNEEPIEALREIGNQNFTDTARIAFDDIYMEANCLYISGWALIEYIDANNAVATVVVNDGDDYWGIPTDMCNRIDLTSALEWHETNYDNSGLNVYRADLRGLPVGEYTVGVIVENGEHRAYADSGYYFTIQGNSKLVESVNLLSAQNKYETEILSEYYASNYTLSNPFVVVDPYGLSPLSALAMFETSKPASITVEVAGLRDTQVISNTFTDMVTSHIIPIYGLYSGEATNVTLTAMYENGKSDSTTISVTGGVYPVGFNAGEVVHSEPKKMADGLTFVSLAMPQNYAFAIDAVGDVRWVYAAQGGASQVAPLTVLENGRILTSISEGTTSYYKYGVQEMDLTGKVYTEYLLNEVHHDMIELPSGNLLILIDEPTGETIEETVAEVDRLTGEVIRYWDMDSYFNVTTVDENGVHISAPNYGDDYDWFHNNSVAYSESDNSMILSARQQDTVVKISMTTGEVVWVLSDNSSEWPADLEDKLLTPIGDDFEYSYGQHHVAILPDGDILIFDNGNYRDKTVEGAWDPSDSYSRVVRYRIDEQAGTVEQVWQYGKERGSESLSMFVGGHDYISENNYLVHFGGIVRDADGKASYEFAAAINGGSSHTQLVEILDDEVIFEYHMSTEGMGGNTYRSKRMNPYTSSSQPTFDEGVRLGLLVNHHSVVETTLNTNNANKLENKVKATDSGITLTLTNLPEGEKLSLYFVGDATYVAAVTIFNNRYRLVAGEVPVDEYRLFLDADGVLYDLELQWNNISMTREIPNRYLVEVTSSDEGMGLAFGSGLYYPNTALALTAIPKDGYQLQGWAIDGLIVSRDKVYSLEPTSDMAVTAVFLPEGKWNSPFDDVIYGAWYYDTVEAAEDRSLFIGTGDNRFSSDILMTGEMVAIILDRISVGKYIVDQDTADVTGLPWGEIISREELAMMLYGYVTTLGLELDITETVVMDFLDISELSELAHEAMSWSVTRGIIEGKENSLLDPTGAATRAELATVMIRFLDIVQV